MAWSELRAAGKPYGISSRPVQDYYEELWRRLPSELASPDLARRSAFLLGHVRPGDAVLDLGCGEGTFTAILAGAGAVPVGLEVARAAIQRARERHPGLDFRTVGIEQPLPFADNAFEVVWASEVIEHVADTARWLSEIRRVLKPRGRLLVTTPDHGRLRLLVGGIERYSEPLGDHLHLYTASTLRRTLRDLGFRDVEIARVGGAPLVRRLLLGAASR